MKAISRQQITQMLFAKMNGRTQKALAAEITVSEQYLSDVLMERREPGPKILEFLGLEKGFLQVKK